MRSTTMLVLALSAAACGQGAPPGPAASAGSMAVVHLTPSSAAAAEPITVTVPASSAQVQLRLAGLDQPALELTAELEAVGGDQIRRWSVDAVPADGDHGAHAVVVPIYEVRPGDYVLSVWAGDADLVRRYRFRVKTP